MKVKNNLNIDQGIYNSTPLSLSGDRSSYAHSLDRYKHQSSRERPKHPTCAQILERKIPKSMQKPPKLREYNRKEDPNKHMQFVNDRLNYYITNNASKVN